MRRTASVLLAAGLALGAIAAEGEPAPEPEPEPAAAEACDAEADPAAFAEEQVWFHEGDSKLGNDAAAPWDTSEPTASFQSGAGAGAVSPGTTDLAAGTPADTRAVFAGTFTGCLDTILFDVWSFDPTNRSGTSATAEPANHNFALTITVDGQTVFSAGPLEANSTLANEGLGPNRNQFSVSLGDVLAQYAELDLLALDGEHQIEVELQSWYVNTGHAAYVWDAAEAPSGMTFNGAITEDHPKVN